MELSYRNNEKSLFRKYAPLVTAFANHQLGRDFLGVKEDKKIGLFLPNGYHRIVAEGKTYVEAQLVVTTRASYAPKLLPALRTIDLLSSFFHDFDEAQRFLFGQLGLISGREFLPLLRQMPHLATHTSYPDANPETTTVDGYAARTPVDEAWATIRAGAGNSSSDSANDLYVLAEATNGHTNFWRQLFRGFALFDTSSIPDDATLTPGASTINPTVNATFSSDNMRLVTTTPASNTALVNADYAQQGTVAQCTDWNGAGGARALNTTGDSNISLTGITKFGFRLAGDADNSAPTWVTATLYGRDYDTNEASATPVELIVTYTVPGGRGYGQIIGA